MSLVTEELRTIAEVYHGNEICQEKSKHLLKEMGLPSGLLPLQDMEEVGYVKETGFVWLKQKRKTQHKFEKIGRHVTYETEVTAHIEPNKVKKITGCKAKELLIWITISDMSLDNPPTGKITFKASTGLARSFPRSAFEIEEVKQESISGAANQVKEV